MAETATSVLAPWSNFYILTGSAAAGLTGLMFVVITLITDAERVRKSSDGISVFSTPTVAHFGAALLVSAMLSAPWGALLYPAALLGLAGLCGVVYMSRVMYRTQRLTFYSPDLADWAWYAILPFVAYGTILVGGIALPAKPVDALFALGAGVAFLIIIGIRNAWDVVTYLAAARDTEPKPR
jgi:hypothetical protein